ncbi:cohesin domain-containing protein [Thalassotalea euphylliae]|uniref:cohesin domain-containing protein n=1 Tax=Thalassotalea euphylliae TaxID=1655234 RepID=UPI0036388902
MKKLLMTLGLMLSLNAQATLLSLNIDEQLYNVGDTVTAEIVVSDIELVAGFQREVAGFNLNLDFDNTLLSLAGISFGNQLDQNAGMSIQTSFDLGTSAFISELSFLPGFVLAFEQSLLSSFVLATVSFEVLAEGQANFGFSNVALTDSTSASFNGLQTQGSSLTLGNTVQVPAPTTLLLALLPAAFLVRRTRQ